MTNRLLHRLCTHLELDASVEAHVSCCPVRPSACEMDQENNLPNLEHPKAKRKLYLIGFLVFELQVLRSKPIGTLYILKVSSTVKRKELCTIICIIRLRHCPTLTKRK